MKKMLLVASAALTLCVPAAAPAAQGGEERCGRPKSFMMIFVPCWLTGATYK
jgi:hypothetical protein